MHPKGPMKKLILLVPTIVVTVFLALAFVAPAAATGVLKTVAPALQAAHINVPSVQFAGAGASVVLSAKAGNSSQAAGSGLAQSSTAAISKSEVTADEGHAVSTAGHSNCGRFGDGFHGGKHAFPCPNRPFPAPAS